MKSPTVLALCLALCLACSQRYEPQPPLAERSRLKCLSLRASYGDDLKRTVGTDAPAVIDPTLGWDEKLKELSGMCEAPSVENVGYCRGLRQYAIRYTAFQERPLDTLGAEEAFRALYKHSLGAAVIVRAVRLKGQAFLVAKVLERGGGPLAWITSHHLSNLEWTTLRRAAAKLPEGRHEYDPRLRKPPPSTARVCEQVDGAYVQIERLQGGFVQVLDGPYEWPTDTRCSDPCCEPDPEAEALSRFFDQLASLVECAKSAPPE
ncbi:MAG: hypothetical protein KJ015_39320 [Myxococcales bacterium]|nr:hypothetical protein [Myxococcales bacterium]